MYLTELLLPISFFLTVFAIVFIVLKARNTERLALIEKGLDASTFEKNKEKRQPRFALLKIGLFLIGGAIGILLGYLLTLTGMRDAPAYLSMIFLFAGIGLLVSYPIAKRFE